MFPWNFFPFSKETQAKMQQMKPDEINQFVQKLMSNMFKSPFPQQMGMNQEEFMANFHPFQTSNEPENRETEKRDSELQYSVFETHDEIFIRVAIQSEEWLTVLRITHTSHLLILEHIPNYDDTHKITLPALVKKKGTTARYKDGVLEIKIPKSIDLQFSEIDITDMK
ncbi:Hsp20/alpha crystallin family protein [Niallia sp. Krafla_26]|uniref:Hsp20/alpha crystallin family protein n=1 Tax=Niallia sp. Krafla_26 TaxID=3064703 RepID=UPI003D172E4A